MFRGYNNIFSRAVLCLTVSGCLTLSVSAQHDVSLPTNSYWRILQTDPAAYSDNPFRVTLFNPKNGEDAGRAWSQTKSIFFYGLVTVGVLAALPESATGWDPDSDIFGKWIDNVRSGPEWDRNNWAYNYIGHTYSGGVYYQVARKSGYRQWDSFVYSFLMSTFYWEYGVEAFAEPPSIQDLVVTPLGGWVYGEWAYRTEIKIRENNSEVLGSGALGSVSLFFLDPIDAFGRCVNFLVRRKWVKAGYGYFSYEPASAETDTDHTVMLNVVIPIGMPSGPAGPVVSGDIQYHTRQSDPVDYGIVGLGLGAGRAVFDDKWLIDDCYYGNISLGLYFTPRFSSRLAYARGDAQDLVSGQDLIYENYSLDFQYYFNAQRRLRPYISGGFGEIIFEEDSDLKSFQWNTGVGLHWQVHEKWALRADWINYFDSEYETHDQNYNVGLIYRFGEGEHQNW
jgi:hypothetical protein